MVRSILSISNLPSQLGLPIFGQLPPYRIKEMHFAPIRSTSAARDDGAKRPTQSNYVLERTDIIIFLNGICHGRSHEKREIEEANKGKKGALSHEKREIEEANKGKKSAL